MKYAVVWIIVVCVAAALFAQLNWSTYFWLARHSSTTIGTVMATFPGNHQIVRYTYEVDGRQFQAEQQVRPPNPEFSAVKVGGSLVVYYDVRQPGTSVLGDPWKLLVNETVAIVCASVLLATAISLFWRFGGFEKLVLRLRDIAGGQRG
jgi:hypothetical protein